MRKVLRFTISILVLSLVMNVHAADKKSKKKGKVEATTIVKPVIIKEEPKPIVMQPISAADTAIFVTIETNMGNIKLRLYNETPKHKANFIKIIQDGVLDSTLFHRVIDEFMIQGGDPNSKNAKVGDRLGMGGLDYRVDAEFNKNLIHKRGVLAAARDNNPAMASSSTQFYIVDGRTFTADELNTLATRTDNHWTEDQKKIYETIGGAPFLDMKYTVFGEVVEGMDVVDKIAKVAKDPYDRPLIDVRMLKISLSRE
ncbi:MAG: peptidylprolyl isomerase [Chitinophagales bacterium]|nr:peptidylprolyl isomerase [Chitinophagales bacterium]